jgi:Ras-related protein Rab-2A
LQEWLREIRSNGSNQLEILVIGNKTDLESQREVSSAEGKAFAETNGLQWAELSAKEYSKVEAAFVKLASSIIGRIESGQIT